MTPPAGSFHDSDKLSPYSWPAARARGQIFLSSRMSVILYLDGCLSDATILLCICYFVAEQNECIVNDRLAMHVQETPRHSSCLSIL